MINQERVIFDRPDLSALRAGFPSHAFVDMHHHTQHSDSYTRVKTLLRRSQALGLGIAITDHNEIRGCLEAIQRQETLVIPGIEVGCKEGPHFLLYFYNPYELKEFFERYVAPHKNQNPYHNLSIGMAELLAAAQRYNCLVTAAHPAAPRYFNLMQRITTCNVDPAVLTDIDAVEVCSGQSFRAMNERAMRLADSFGKSFVGGSDGHVMSALGSTVTHAKSTSVASFLNAIRKQRNFVVGWEMPLVQRLHPYSGMSLRYLRYPSTLPYYYRYHVREQLDRVGPKFAAAVARMF